MSVKDLHIFLENYFTKFFEDFNYNKSLEYPIFKQAGIDCQKIIYLNTVDYQDGLMIEFMLGISHPTIELQLSELLEKPLPVDQHFTFQVYLNSIDESLPKRSFLNPAETTAHYCKHMESFFTHKGFYWLDEFSNMKKLSDLLALSLVKYDLPYLKLNYAAIRSLLLKRQLGEKITEDLFYTYLELMQEKGLPEYEIGQYAQLRKYFIPR